MALKTWSGGEHEFALPIGELRALQTACDAGPEEIAHILISGKWRDHHVTNTLRFGLIGGGMDAKEANRMMIDIFDLHPPMMLKATALEVITDWLTQEDGDELGEDEGSADPQESGDLASSTD